MPYLSFTTDRARAGNPETWLQTRVAWRYRASPPGGSSRNPENTQIGMSRLAAMYSPPGGFWKFSKNHKFTNTTAITHAPLTWILLLGFYVLPPSC